MEIEEIDVEQMLEMVREGAQLIDVRESEELETDGSIDGMVHMPLSEFESYEEEVAKDRPVIIYCRSGRRSLRAAEIAAEWTSEPVYSLRGGILAYKKAYE